MWKNESFNQELRFVLNRMKRIPNVIHFFQGRAQGCITGICSFAHMVSPFVFSPLTGNLNFLSFFLFLLRIKKYELLIILGRSFSSSISFWKGAISVSRIQYFMCCFCRGKEVKSFHQTLKECNDLCKIFDYLVLFFVDASFHSEPVDQEECWTRNELLQR